MKKGRMTFIMLFAVLALVLAMAAPAMAWEGASSYLTLSASATEVTPGSTVTLTITETNDSAPTYTDGFSPAGVVLETYVGGALVGTLILQEFSPEFTGDDSVNPGVLDSGETWAWDVDVTVDEETTFVATGHGITSDGNDVTYPADPDERDMVTVYVTPPPGDEGFTPGYWRNHLEDWPATGFSPADDFDATFGIDGFDPDITLLDAIWLGGGGANALARHATAAILNAAHPDVDYPVTVAQIIDAVQLVWGDPGSMNALKSILDEFNNLGGDI